MWDYPRPPRLETTAKVIQVSHDGGIIALTSKGVRVLETASPPTVYLPPEDVDLTQLRHVAGTSHCEWKGQAVYYALAGGDDTVVAWLYPRPSEAFSMIAGYFSFYPGRVNCLMNGERVQPQPGYFYGGWITSEIAGPFKGEPGTGHW